MIAPEKLFHFQAGHRRRKLALCFGSIERDILQIAEKNCSYDFSLPRSEYVKKLLHVLLSDPQLSAEAQTDLTTLLNENPFDELRACNTAKNHLLVIMKTSPAEWDLVIAPHRNVSQQEVERTIFEGVQIYAEDIRSPFNIGSIFRTAEAMGAEKLFVSPFCCDPLHSRAIRSGMGCIENMDWQRASLDDLSSDLPIFVLETGGTPINEFKFPKKGIVILGSEELGVSPKALKKASYGCVSIPMNGIKNSLNVGVAFGILLNAWITQLEKDQASI
ncbi:MAG: TrmH family RNA methyltransferase [Treponemataceae bacterium]